jgi:hypothetical protein
MSPDSEAAVVLILGILFSLFIIITSLYTIHLLFLTADQMIEGDAIIRLDAKFVALDGEILGCATQQ